MGLGGRLGIYTQSHQQVSCHHAVKLWKPLPQRNCCPPHGTRCWGSERREGWKGVHLGIIAPRLTCDMLFRIGNMCVSKFRNISAYLYSVQKNNCFNRWSRPFTAACCLVLRPGDLYSPATITGGAKHSAGDECCEMKWHIYLAIRDKYIYTNNVS